MPYIANKTAKNFEKLANLLGIPAKHGWKQELNAALKLPKGSISTWVSRNKISADGMEKIERKGFPRETWHIFDTDDDTHPGVQDAAPIYPLTNEKKLCQDIRTILKKGDISTIQALTMNIREFVNIVIQKEQCLTEMNKLQDEITLLNQKMDNLLKIEKIKKKAAE